MIDGINSKLEMHGVAMKDEKGKNMNAPCYNCYERYIGCHDSCEKYREYKIKVGEINQEKIEYNDFLIYKKCVIYKTKRMFNNARRMKGG